MIQVNYLVAAAIVFCAFQNLVFGVSQKEEQFYIRNILKDGVHEIVLKTHGIIGIETAVGPKEGSDRGVVVRQLCNGRQVVTLVYNGIPPSLEEEEAAKTSPTEDPPLVEPDEDTLLLRECKVEKKLEEVDNFLGKFQERVALSRDVAKGISSSSKHILESDVELIKHNLINLPQAVVHLSRFRHYKHQCFDLHRKERRVARENRRIQWKKNTSTLQRSRRAVASIFSMPHTKWCGAGSFAKTYGDLGGLHGADMCCRQHDMHCPYFIESFSKKYGHFNYRLSTLSHCSCDRRFRACLKHTGTGASDVVGEVFFNLLKAKCFVFERKRVCRKGSFWRCYKYGYERQAVVKDPAPWKW